MLRTDEERGGAPRGDVGLRYASKTASTPCEGYLMARWRTLLPFPKKRFYFTLSGATLTCQDDPYSPVLWEDSVAHMDLAVRKRGRDAELVLEEDRVVLLRLVPTTLHDFNSWFLALRKTCKASFNKFYQLGERVGKGHYAQVFQARDKTTRDQFAVKVLDKSELANKPKFIEREKDIMRHVSHPNVVRTYDIFETEDCCYIVMELCDGGRLFDSLLQVKQYTEPEARKVMEQVLLGVAYLHDNDIVHRDIKAENVLLQRPTAAGAPDSQMAHAPSGLLKISDFGLSRRLGEQGPGDGAETLLRSCAGTPQYIAPEILLRQPYSKKADIWSLGVLLYVLLSGTYPFMAEKVTKVLEKVASGRLRFPAKHWENVSPDAVALVQRMLSYKPNDRPTVHEVMSNIWVRDGKPDEPKRGESFVASVVTSSGDSSVEHAARALKTTEKAVRALSFGKAMQRHESDTSKAEVQAARARGVSGRDMRSLQDGSEISGR